MTTDYARIRLALPCSLLREGLNGVEQYPEVRSKIGELLRNKLIESSRKRGGQGWYLTARGRKEASWMRAEARRADREAKKAGQ
jgi:hypothetical protein